MTNEVVDRYYLNQINEENTNNILVLNSKVDDIKRYCFNNIDNYVISHKVVYLLLYNCRHYDNMRTVFYINDCSSVGREIVQDFDLIFVYSGISDIQDVYQKFFRTCFESLALFERELRKYGCFVFDNSKNGKLYYYVNNRIDLLTKYTKLNENIVDYIDRRISTIS